MYGLVNKGIQEFAISQGGEALWDKIVEASGVDESSFLSMETYPDQMTYQLVAAASDVLDISPNDVLRNFGKFWVVYTGSVGYGDLMAVGGANLYEFLCNLDHLHSRIKVSLDELQPPRFECLKKDAGMELHYYSQRSGLEAMVVGLIEGLAEKFNEHVEVHISRLRSEVDESSIFIIKHIE